MALWIWLFALWWGMEAYFGSSLTGLLRVIWGGYLWHLGLTPSCPCPFISLITILQSRGKARGFSGFMGWGQGRDMGTYKPFPIMGWAGCPRNFCWNLKFKSVDFGAFWQLARAWWWLAVFKGQKGYQQFLTGFAHPTRPWWQVVPPSRGFAPAPKSPQLQGQM